MNTQTKAEAIYRRELAIALDNSRPLETHRVGQGPEVTAALKGIYKELGLTGTKSRLRKVRKHVKVICADLWLSYLQDPAQYLGVSLNRNRYNQRSRYNGMKCGYWSMRHAIDALEEHEFIELHKGFHCATTGKGKQTRIKATGKLLDAIGKQVLQVNMVDMVENKESVVLRGGRPTKAFPEGTGKDLEYEDDAETNRIRGQLRRYMAKLHMHEITNPAYKAAPLPRAHVRRVFNRGKWDNGGRYYGGVWQNCKKHFRPGFLIDGETTVELDFKALHPCLAYWVKGIDWWDKVKSLQEQWRDPYYMFGFENDSKERAFFKVAFNTALNAQNFESARSAIQREVSFNPEKYPDALRMPGQLLQMLGCIAGEGGRHQPIMDLLYSDIGLYMQYIDSRIAEGVIDAFLQVDKPVLCVHDSFIVKKSDQALLKQAMIDSYKQITGFVPEIK